MTRIFTVMPSPRANAIVGTFTSDDPNPGDTFAYSLVSGMGATENAAFNISGSTLRANDSGMMVAGGYAERIRGEG